MSRARRDKREHVTFLCRGWHTGYLVRTLTRGPRKGWLVVETCEGERTVDPASTRECRCNRCWRRIEAEVNA